MQYLYALFRGENLCMIHEKPLNCDVCMGYLSVTTHKQNMTGGMQALGMK